MAQQGSNASGSASRRSIVLFSDGTGNSSSKLQKTNVWRLYEALDLGYPANAASLRELTRICGTGAPNVHDEIQLASYDDGVGTSSFKVLAILGGVFGLGLARNVRDLYKFFCRNYRDGDRIYAFGFSRGAYTIRLLVAMIAVLGVVQYDGVSETELDLRSRDKWREFRRGFRTNNPWSDLLVCILRFAADLLVLAKRGAFFQPRPAPTEGRERRNWFCEWWAYWRATILMWFPPPVRRWILRKTAGCAPVKRKQVGPEIEFVGVWDTVAAYGGPFVEITRGIDEFIWPLTMPDYHLSPKIKCARHALAIDDKRDTFHPLLWDEVEETDRDEENPRIQQVWFTGMHSDVGGGYPDETLSFVSLLWMVEHAERAGLRLLVEHRNRIEHMSNVYGPLHDSRGGGGAFYRYQPRYIDAWVDQAPDDSSEDRAIHLIPATQIFRDPTIDAGRYVRHGMLVAPVRLHKSVQERLKMATDGYGPNNLPTHYVVDDGVRGVSPAGVVADASEPHLLALGDRIKLRRFWYFLSIAMVALIALKPFWGSIRWLEQLNGSIDARTDAQILATAANAFLPAFASRWTNAFAADPFISLAAFLLLFAFVAFGVGHEREMVDISRGMWRARFDGTKPALPEVGVLSRPAHWVARRVHTTNWLQWGLGWIKWRAAPVVVGALLWLALAYALIAGLTQLWLVWGEQRPELCQRTGDEVTSGSVTRTVSIADTCAPLGMRIARSKEEQTYSIRVEMLGGNGEPGRWLDETSPASPLGWDEPVSATLKHSLAQGRLTGWMPNGLSSLVARFPHDSSKFLRRVVSADLLQPVIEIREVAASQDCWRPVAASWFGDCIYMLVPELKRQGASNVYSGTFTVPPGKRGEFHFFVNDALLPLDPGVPEDLECPAAKDKGWKFFQISGRYANNCGKAKVTLTRLE